MTASAARRGASAPLPPQTSTVSLFSKKRKLRPAYSFRRTRQCFSSGFTSLSSAATMAILNISVAPEPFHRPPQRVFDGDDLPTQLAFRFVGTGKHFFLAHAHSIDGRAWLALQ